MKFNALQRYLLNVYSIVIILLTILVPTYNSTGNSSFGFILFNYVSEINVSFLLTEYLAATLSLVAALFAASSKK